MKARDEIFYNFHTPLYLSVPNLDSNFCTAQTSKLQQQCVSRSSSSGRSGTSRSARSSARGGTSTSRVPKFCQLLAKFRQNVARFRLYRHRFLQVNMRLAAFFKIYQILKLKFLKFGKILQILQYLQNFAEFSRKLLIFQTEFFAKILRLQRCKSIHIL